MVNLFPQSGALCCLLSVSYLDWWIVAMKCIFSPLCVSKCGFRCTGWLNVLSHCTHLWFFSPLWMSRCLFRFTTLLNDLLQSGQRGIFIHCVSVSESVNNKEYHELNMNFILSCALEGKEPCDGNYIVYNIVIIGEEMILFELILHLLRAFRKSSRNLELILILKLH